MDTPQQPAKPVLYVLARFQCVGSALQNLFEARSKLSATGVRGDSEIAERIDVIARDLQETRDALLRGMDELGLSTKLTLIERVQISLAGLPKAERLWICAEQLRDCWTDVEADGAAELLGALAATIERQAGEVGTATKGDDHV